MTAVYASARHQGLTDDMIAALPDFENSALFTPAEKAAFRFADSMAGDFHSIDKQRIDDLAHYYTEPEIMALGWRMAIFVGYGRLVWATGLQSVGGLCPLSFAHEEMH
jgi:alkylhydroperoxidase family enzyme